MSLTIRALGVWFLLLIAAMVNGTVRQAVLLPLMGEQNGRFVSTLLLSAFIFGIGWLTSGFLDPGSSRDAYAVGALWLGLTLCFEFLAGHFLFGASWSKLLEDYNLAEGRIWILVLVTTALTPVIVFRLDR
jgi:hypothetical protein